MKFLFIQSAYVNEAGDVISTFGDAPYAISGLPFNMEASSAFSVLFSFHKSRFEGDGKVIGKKQYICETCSILWELPDSGGH